MTRDRTIPPLVSGGVMFSYRCTNACRHCLCRCSPVRPDEWMSPRAGSAAPLFSRAARLKALAPDCLVVANAPTPGVRPEELNDPNIDLVVIGRGMEKLREIASSLESGVPLKWIAGLALTGASLEFIDPRDRRRVSRMARTRSRSISSVAEA